MPADDVSDLRDVVDAINRLCETMKTSAYDEVCEEAAEANWQEEEAVAVEGDDPAALTLISPEEVAVDEVVTHVAERWSDTSPTDATVASDGERATAVSEYEHAAAVSEYEQANVVSDNDHTAVYFEPQSEMYYTASEVSLLSDEAPERVQDDDRVRDDRQSVIAGHVAAMRERFESMTRANTPCPDLARSLSPSLDVFRNITPSPDRLD